MATIARMSAPRRRPQRGPELDARRCGAAGSARRRRPLLVLLLVARRPADGRRRRRAAPASTRSGRRATSRRCARCGSARTRSSTPPTARCSARSRPSATGRSSRCARVSPWMPKATVAIEDRRFYSHGGDRPAGHRPRRRRRRPGARGRPGRLDDHAAARPQPLHLERAHAAAEAEGGVPRDQAQRRLVEAADPRDVPQPGLLRQSRLRDRGGGADLLLEAGAGAQPPRGGAARRADAGAVRVRPVRRDREGARAPQRGPRRDARPGRDHAEAVRAGRRGSTDLQPEARAGSTRRSASRTSSATSATSSIRKYGAETVRSGGLSVYTTIVPRWQRAAQDAIRETLTEPRRSRPPP